MAIGQAPGWDNVSIAASSVNATGNVAKAVEDTMAQMNTLADQLDQGKITQAQFQALMLKYQLTMDMLKQLMNAIDQAAQQFHNPNG